MVQSPGRLGEYLKDVNNKFVGCVAAPLVGEGAMIAYLMTDQTRTVFENLSNRLDQTLEEVPSFNDRPHRISHHLRHSAPELRLHHMLMQCVEPTEEDDPTV